MLQTRCMCFFNFKNGKFLVESVFLILKLSDKRVLTAFLILKNGKILVAGAFSIL